MKHILALLLTVSCSAFAADNGSQYQWQTPADKWEATPMIMMGNIKATPKGGGSDIKINTMRYGVKGEYGISEMFSAGLNLTMSNTKTEVGTSSTKSSGMDDIGLFFHGRSAMGGGSLRYGLDAGLGLAKSEIDTSGDSNASSGGISLAPFVGYEMSSTSCTYGARLSYKMFMGERSETDKTSTPADDNKLTGPTTTTLGLFYEHNMAPVIIGAALEIAGTSEEKQKTNGGASARSADPLTMTSLKVYVPYMVNEMITILPELKYNKGTAINTSSFDSLSGIDFQVAGRFTF